MESGGRSGGGRGKGKKGKKKVVNPTQQDGKKGSSNVRFKATGTKPAGAIDATEECWKSTKVTQDQTLSKKTKRKRLKNSIGGGSAMSKEHMVTESGTLKTSVLVQDQLIQKSTNAVAVVKSNDVAVKGAMKKKRKRNVPLKANLTGTTDSDRATTTMSSKEGPTTDGPKSLLIAAQPMKKKVSARGQSQAATTVTKQTEMVVATNLKRKIAQVGKVTTKLPTQRTRNSESVSAAVASPRKKAKHEKSKVVELPAGSTSMLPKDESRAAVKKLKAKIKVRQSIGGVTAFKKMASPVKGTLMLQELPQADAAITAKPKDEVTTTSCTHVTTTKKTNANADSGPLTAAVDDFACSRPASDASTTDPAISPKPSHTASAAASLSTACGKPVLQEAKPDEATNPLAETITTSPALLASAFTPKLATARLVTPPIARSKVTGGRHKRRRSIDQASTNSANDPLQPPTKRSAGSSKDAFRQSKADEPNEAQSSANEERAALHQLANLPRHKAVPEPAHTPVTVQENHEPAIKVVAEQATRTVEATAPPSQFEAKKLEKTEPVDLYRYATQPAQLLTSTTPLEPAPEHETSSMQAQAALCNDFRPSATPLESTVKAESAASATAPSKSGGVGLQSIGASFESDATKEIGIVIDSRTYVQKMMSSDMETSSHGTQSVQSIASFPPRPRNAWGASFGMVPPAPGASSVSRTLSTTPLSSWFLSKGCANFVKHVQFLDDDDAGDSSSSEDDVPATRQPSALHGTDKAPIKRRGSATKKNAFLESLTTQSYWRTWYGTVDLHNLIDPPLVYVPEKLRTHEVIPLSLPTPRTESDVNTLVKKNGLESLEADIRQEKQRGSAFSEQLLMMLQGKTVSGKSLEEEYRLLLR